MAEMTKKERIVAALNKDDVDRIPTNIWWHYTNIDQCPITLAQAQVATMRKYDFDFIKMMPFGLYGVNDYGRSVTFNQTLSFGNIKIYGHFEGDTTLERTEDWAKLKVLPATYGNYGKALQLAQHIKRILGRDDTPAIQTIYSPLTTAVKLAGAKRVQHDMSEHPDLFSAALEVITETTINFVKANIEAGVDGFFLASQTASSAFCSEELYETFGKFYDLKVLDAYKDITYFNAVHIHGANTYWRTLSEYPVKAINWHDRWVPPTMADARKLSDKCFMGGLHETGVLSTANPDGVRMHVMEAIDSAGRKGLILTPGCVAAPDDRSLDFHIPVENIFAVRNAAEAYSKT
jgi:uroporphyrinogen decarboxylase